MFFGDGPEGDKFPNASVCENNIDTLCPKGEANPQMGLGRLNTQRAIGARRLLAQSLVSILRRTGSADSAEALAQLLCEKSWPLEGGELVTLL